MPESLNLELPLMVSDMLDPFLVLGKRYKVTYHLESNSYSEKAGRHSSTGELIKINKPKRFYDKYNSWIELKGKNGNHTIRVQDILRIQGVR